MKIYLKKNKIAFAAGICMNYEARNPHENSMMMAGSGFIIDKKNRPFYYLLFWALMNKKHMMDDEEKWGFEKSWGSYDLKFLCEINEKP